MTPAPELVLISGPREIERIQAEIAGLRTQVAEQKYKTHDGWTSALTSVGTGRGFLVKTDGDSPLVVTAASCLPYLPRPEITFDPNDRNYRALVGYPENERRVSAWSHFIDLIANVAVLGSPCGDEYEIDWRRFKALTCGNTPMSIADPPKKNSLAWIPSLDGRWFRCILYNTGHQLYLYEHVEDIVAEMAGLPIVVDDGSVIGVVSNTRQPADEHWVGMQPRLTEVLPRWLLQCSMVPLRLQ
jgi:hypothetical protein